MRQEFIELIKEYINATPNHNKALHEIKANVLIMGATEEEFDEAIKQLSEDPSLHHGFKYNVLKNTTGGKKNTDEEQPKSVPTKLLKLDIFTHIMVVGVVAVFAIAFFSPYLVGKYNSIVRHVNTAEIADISETSDKPNKITQQVYASTRIVDADKVFSFPKSNVTLTITSTPKKEIFGFFPYWMLPRADDISLDSLTSVSLFGLETDGGGNIIVATNDGTPDPGWSMWNDEALTKLIRRLKAKRIKTHITLKAFNNTNIEKLVLSDDAQRTFISNAMHLIETKNLDGINLDFEYVGTPDKQVTDAFTRLVTNLNGELKRRFPTAQLTICTYIVSATTPGFFDVEMLANQSDALVIMGYDIHTPSGSAGPIAPMNGEGLNMLGLMQSYLEKISPDKLILAVPYYGYDWTSSGTASILPYAELAETSKTNTLIWNDVSQTPSYKYIDAATNTKHEVHFENTRSLGIKYDFVNKKELKGVGIWALGYDGHNTDLRQLLMDKFAN